MELTQKQKTLLSYINKVQSDTHQTPSLRQCASNLGVSHAAVAQSLNTLEKKGAIQRDGRYGRQITILVSEKPAAFEKNTRPVPIIGSIAAGMPLYAQQEWDGTLVVDASMYTGETLFALKIKGDSMKDAAILDGDLVICEPRQFAKNGEIVVALINNDDATVKRFYLKKNKIVLQPENPDFKPISYTFDEILIQGKVVGVIRGPGAFG